jgi:hypothetical protein
VEVQTPGYAQGYIWFLSPQRAAQGRNQSVATAGALWGKGRRVEVQEDGCMGREGRSSCHVCDGGA